MSDALTDEDIALLCDISEYNLAKASEVQTRRLERLLAGGFVERDGTGFKPTRKGVEAVTSRGAGLNEG